MKNSPLSVGNLGNVSWSWEKFYLGLYKSHIRLIDIQWVVTLINYNLKCYKMLIIQSALLGSQSPTAFYLQQMIPNGHTSPYHDLIRFFK